MANGFDPRVNASPQTTTRPREGVAFDAGLRSYMLSVYNYMASGGLLTGIVALLFASSGYAAQILMGQGIPKYFILFSPLHSVMVMRFGITRDRAERRGGKR